ncbi:MAG: strictosidine synthase [Burkholderiaceae bacterium]|jgi:hypothetical protein
MSTALKAWADRLLGRGEAAITVPVMDGALKPNRALENATVVAELPGIEDLASDGQKLWVAAGNILYELVGEELHKVETFDAPITGLAVRSASERALAIGGQKIVVVGGAHGGAILTSLGSEPLLSVNALAFDEEGNLYFTEGSARYPLEKWNFDLMSLGQSGRVGYWSLTDNSAREVRRGLAYPFGVLVSGAEILVSESWRHRVLRLGQGKPVELLHELPGYPSRLSGALGGGFWLTCFVCRTQLVEFVLREPDYRRRMMEEVDPRYWVAPALSSGTSFLEPLQGAGVKQMGVLKPWAPPRSYGLVVRVSASGEILYSFHSRVDGHHHGITAVCECGGALYVASKGAGRLLRLAPGAPVESENV